MKQLCTIVLVVILSSCSIFTPNKFEKNHRTPGTKIDDEVIVNNINLQIKKNKLFKKDHINITSFNAIVLITGEIANKKSKNKLTKIVNGIYQVRKVYNQTKLVAPSALMARASDSLITTNIAAKLLGNKIANSAETNIVTEAGVVYLLGIVSKKQAKLIVHIVKSVSGVQRIVKLFEIID